MSNQNKFTRLIGTAILFIASALLPIGIEKLLQVPTEEWLNVNWYYIVFELVMLLLLILIWALPFHKEKDKVDKLIDEVEELINEIRQERNERNNKPNT
jgi:uncharacterized membrane protein